MSFDEIFPTVDQDLGAADALREEILQKTRKIVRMASETIKAVHREQWDVADGHITEMRALLQDVNHQVTQHLILTRRNYTESCEQEFAEAAILYSILHVGQIPTPEELEIPSLSWLLGLADVSGELRRHSLDGIRKGDIATAQASLDLMEEIYSHLFSLDYPKGLTGGLREKTDMVRKLLQATRGDVAMASHTARLNDNIEKILAEREKE
jgi:translin